MVLIRMMRSQETLKLNDGLDSRALSGLRVLMLTLAHVLVLETQSNVWTVV